MSSKTHNIFSESFSSYADALYKYLEYKGIEKVWLAEKITPNGQKVISTQEKLSRWKREGTKPSKKTRNKIDEIFSIQIYQNNNSRWKILRTYESGPPNVEELMTEYKYRKEDHGFSDTERGQLLLNILNDAESLAAKLRQLIQTEKNRSDH